MGDFEEFGDYLLQNGLHEDVVATVISNRICSETFLHLTESDLKELAPTVGDRIRLRKILEDTRKVRFLDYFIFHYSYKYDFIRVEVLTNNPLSHKTMEWK